MTKNKKGFTLIELSIAIVFIAMLLLTISWLTIHITTTYEKGLTMKSVSSTAKAMIDDFSRAIATAPPHSVDSLCSSKYSGNAYDDCVADNARKFIYQQRYGSVKINGEITQVPVHGALCTGQYSYIWNTAYTLNENDYPSSDGHTDYRATFYYNDTSTDDFRLLKVTDYTRQVCADKLDDKKYIYNNTTDYHITTGISEQQTLKDLLDRSTDGTNTHLALYDLVVFPPTTHKATGTSFLSGTFILATLRGGININTAGNFCSEPAENLSTDFAYCAINKYNFSTRTSGETANPQQTQTGSGAMIL